MLDFALFIVTTRIAVTRWWQVILLTTPIFLAGCGAMHAITPVAEVRGTWLTTTANDAISSAENTAVSMRRLREIGLNTVYVEAWKNGETQFPSTVLLRALGGSFSNKPKRDLMQETLLEAHRNGLIYIAWFEYGFMAAHQSSMNLLRTQKAAWLSRDINGSEIAPNGFVWMNPLHPEARRFLLDLILEAIDNYDLDGVQLDDRIVWPHISMGYDEYTKKAYANEHGGNTPPANHRDPAWMRWRADKVNEVAKWFVQEIRARRPGLVISLSPATFPWSWQNNLLAWPVWSGWTAKDRLHSAEFQSDASRSVTPRWDEFVAQAYRLSFDAFAKTWAEQIDAVNTLGIERTNDLIAGIRIDGDGKPSSWEQLRDSIALARKRGNGGHVLWFSRGVLTLYSIELSQLYAANGPARSPHFDAAWRKPAITLQRMSSGDATAESVRWSGTAIPLDQYHLIGFASGAWQYIDEAPIEFGSSVAGMLSLALPAKFTAVELIVDRRKAMANLLIRGVR